MITVWKKIVRTARGDVRRYVYARVVNESLTPLDVLAPVIPKCEGRHARTGERVRVNRAGTWAVWKCVDKIVRVR